MDQVKTVSKDDLFSWVAKALEHEDIKEYKTSLDGTSNKCDGYIGEIVFVKAIGRTNDNEEKILHLVVKHSKQNDHLRSSPFKLMFDAEIHFYDIVYPVLERFQSEKNLPCAFDVVPKCFKTLLLDMKEVLVFDNFKVQGYEQYDRKKPLNIFHMKTILEQFGKLHALSFALRDQRREEFESILKEYPNFMGNFLTSRRTRGVFKRALDNGLKSLLNHGELELVNKFTTMLSDIGGDPADIMANLAGANEPQSVIVHGDAWNNNFLFKYKGNNKTTPSHVVILDWQTSYLRSPVIDLAFFFYTTSSSRELQHFDQLMKIYHESFSSFLRALGSNPEELFPVSSLKTHWRKYSPYGLIFSSLLLSFVLCDKENAPAFEDLQDENGMEDMLIIDISKNELYFQRFRDVVRHYFECTF